MRNFLRQRLGLILVVAAVVLFLSGNRIATFLTDVWWFDALGYREVYVDILWTQIFIGLVFGAVLAALVAGNLLIVRRIRPLFVPSTPQQAAIERYRTMADPYLPWLIAGIAVVFGISAGLAVATQWEPFLLWRNAQTFGIEDPQFGRDVGYYVFSLPWLKFVQTWLFTSLLLVMLLTAGAHYLLGGIRPENPGEKVMPNVKVHLSLLLAAVLAARGWGYWLDRFMLNFSPRGQVTGASYTDVNAELPALNLLLIVTAVAIALVVWNVRRRGFLLPGVAIGLLIVASIILQGVYPAAIQRLRVEPQELVREDEFIGRNLDATLHAYRLDEVDFNQFPIANDLTAEEVAENEVTVQNVRLWDPAVLQTTYEELQALRPYYRFNDVDVDRYMIDGELRQIMLSTRELDIPGLPDQAQTWQNRTLTYTHGFGVVASKVNTATIEGQPVFVAEDIPPSGDDELVPDQQAGIYFGERENPRYSIVDTLNEEIEYEDPETARQVYTTYAGEGGVPIGSFFRRAMFALRFSDPNILLSNLLTDDSQILLKRDVGERVAAVAPYLRLDHDPYPVVIGGKIKWIQDAYTFSNHYPYSERRVLTTMTRTQVNYVRNSVKAVVDAYDGTVDLYVVDEEDPVLQAWRQAFPQPYRPMSELPQGLREHFRYPEDLFTLQSEVYTTYHITGVAEFYSKADAWEIPQDAAALANRQDLTQPPPLRPYYLLMRLPGETDEEFVLIQPYKPRNQPIMIAWLAARSDPEHYGELFAVQFPTDQSPLGPSQVQARIEQEDEIAEYITLRDQRGSQVIRGNMLVLPIEESILYVEPFFLQNEQAEIPELDKVVIVMGDRVAFEDTLAEAIATLVGAAEPPIEEEQPTQPDEEDGEEEEADIAELVVRALELYEDAQEALQDGELGRYQQLIDQIQGLLQRIAELEGVTPPPDEGTSPGGAGSPSPTETTTEGG